MICCLPALSMESIWAAPHLLLSSRRQTITKRSFCALLSLIFVCLLAYNTLAIFSTRVSFPVKIHSPESASVADTPSAKRSPTTVKGGARFKTHLPLLHKNRNSVLFTNKNGPNHPGKGSFWRTTKALRYVPKSKRFQARVLEFLDSNCKYRFFMTWISSLESFGDRQLYAIESLFKVHPNGCLIIVSDSLDSVNGMQIFKPFRNKGFKVTSIAPDFDYLFDDTPAQSWYNQLLQGKVNPGEVSLGQNLSNLLRLGLLYRFGGIYLDTDVIVLKSVEGLRNVIGAQTMDLDSGNWSRLNNAVMIFDEAHPLLYQFIQEFALTFDGNKWGHNGPYLVSRVVSRITGRPGYDFNVLPPRAFYPVDWSRIGSFFQGPMNLNESEWSLAKLRQLRSQSYTVHLWNKQSKAFKVEKGSIIDHLISGSCIFCRSITAAA